MGITGSRAASWDCYYAGVHMGSNNSTTLNHIINLRISFRSYHVCYRQDYLTEGIGRWIQPAATHYVNGNVHTRFVWVEKQRHDT